ncbi:MAG TPA: tetratricopeptide repeat protein [Hypericibacter adhaerens]|uniref:tetratricopeptide repeat protein n=1 Tax=Hypericibacter adhaerens TaxID=2602016 RepID=UPI002C7C7EC1|nr:tetratricopeptide repeat protein [Hypericibacter adhaerens]HWA42794.1 tetratricopeptide repeat protein [Hypericibacter adhaerens]
MPSIEQGLALHRAGRLDDAAALYARRLAQRPDDAESLHLLGLIRQQQGSPQAAVPLIERACALEPRVPLFRANLAVVLSAAGRSAEAIAAASEAVALQPGNADLLFTLATMLEQGGRLAEAEASYRAALERRPDHADAAYNLARLLHKREALADSVPFYRRALASRPGFVSALMNLGSALGRLGEIEEATSLLARARQLEPQNPHPVAAQGLLAADRGDLAEATAILARLAHAPMDPVLLHQLGTLARQTGRFEEAIGYFEKVLARAPDSTDARLSISLMRLTLGRFADGWRDYRSRWYLAPHTNLARRYPGPAWAGEPFPDRTVLVYPEQGMGDVIQFARYLPLAAARGGRVIFECPAALRRLFQPFHENVTVVPQGSPLPAADLSVPLLDLPILFDTRLETVPPLLPNLAPDPGLVASWAAKLEPGRQRGLRIGLVWRGNPGFANDRNRSLDLAHLRPLIEGSRAQFISLQKGPAAAEIAANGWQDRILDLGPELGDFADTAAVIAGLDLVLSVDTAVAHLAGSLGRPVWILIPFIPDWRWLFARADSPWYPSARLFRQKSPGDWAPPVAEIGAALQRVSPAEGPGAAPR